MSIFELFGKLILIGVLITGGVAVYRLVWVEPEVRTEAERENIRINQAPGDGSQITSGNRSTEDCERYINPEHIQSCVEARQAEQAD